MKRFILEFIESFGIAAVIATAAVTFLLIWSASWPFMLVMTGAIMIVRFLVNGALDNHRRTTFRATHHIWAEAAAENARKKSDSTHPFA